MNLDKYLKAALVLGVLLAGAGVFYYFVLFLPSVERDKQALAASEKLQRTQAYERCKAVADTVYDFDWANACKTTAQNSARLLAQCLEDPTITGNPYMGKRYCANTYGNADAKPECTLPNSVAENLNRRVKEAREKCLNEAKIGF